MTVLERLRKKANKIRFRVIENSAKTGTPHLGSCLSCVDILTALYFSKALDLDIKSIDNSTRNRFILSKGHAAPALFCTLAEKGIIAESAMLTYGENGSYLGEHPPSPEHLPGIEAATGSLGHGLPMGLGMALASRIQKKHFNVFVLLGDGECNEGSVWEAAMLASAQGVKNLCVIVDYNKWQATDRSNEVMSISPLDKKWEAFGWDVMSIDGHDFSAILHSIKQMVNSDKPLAIIANTIKGKGVSFMEDDNNWHYRIPKEEEVAIAKMELEV